jgi:two-component system sensor histidine kinase PilS (NtrC family)
MCWRPGSSFNFAALLVLPVLMAGVLTSRLRALATAAGVTLMLLFMAWRGARLGGDRNALMLQAGLAGLGLFVITLLSGELAGRLAREELAARGSLELARQQAQLNRLVIEEMVDGVLVVDHRLRVRAANPAARELLAEQGLSPSAPFPLRRAGLGCRCRRPSRRRWRPVRTWPEAGRDIALTFESGHTPHAARARALHAPARCRGDAAMGRRAVLRAAAGGRAHRRGPAAAGKAGRNGPRVGRHRPRDPQPAGRHLRRPTRCCSRTSCRRHAAAAGAHRGRQRRAAQAHRRRRDGSRPGRRAARGARDRCHRRGRGGRAEWARTVACHWLGQPAARGTADPAAGRDASTPSTCAVCWSTCWTTPTATPATRRGDLPALVVRDDASGAVGRQRQPADPPEVERYLFEPFFSTRSRGTGLGLYICRELCERYRASIEYRAPAAERLRNEFRVVMLRGRP